MPTAQEKNIQAGQTYTVSNRQQQEDEQETSVTKVVIKKGKNRLKGQNAGTHNQQTIGTRNQLPVAGSQVHEQQTASSERRRQFGQQSKLGTHCVGLNSAIGCNGQIIGAECNEKLKEKLDE